MVHGTTAAALTSSSTCRKVLEKNCVALPDVVYVACMLRVALLWCRDSLALLVPVATVKELKQDLGWDGTIGV
jgi:hypothetical protein